MIEKIVETGINRRTFLRLSAATAILNPFSIDYAVGEEMPLTQPIEQQIIKMMKAGRIESDEVVAFLVYDHTADKLLVARHANIPLQTASTVKPMLGLAALLDVKNGSIKDDNDFKIHFEKMIAKSDNDSTNIIFDKVKGPHRAEKILRDNYPEIFKGIRIVEVIPSEGKTYENRASAMDHFRFWKALYENKVHGAGRIKKEMYRATATIFPWSAKESDADVYHKIGKTAHQKSGVGTVIRKDKSGKEHAYTIVAILEKNQRPKDREEYRKYNARVDDVLQDLSVTANSYMRRKYDLLPAK